MFHKFFTKYIYITEYLICVSREAILSTYTIIPIILNIIKIQNCYEKNASIIIAIDGKFMGKYLCKISGRCFLIQ